MVNDFYAKGLSKGDLEALLKLLSPFAPHMVEEMWELMGYAAKYGKMCMQMPWPEYDESKTIDAGRAEEPVQPDPAEKEHRCSDGEDNDRCGEVRLKHEQRRNGRQYCRKRRDAVPEGAHPVFIFAYQRRKVKNNCDFCNF